MCLRIVTRGNYPVPFCNSSIEVILNVSFFHEIPQLCPLYAPDNTFQMGPPFPTKFDTGPV